MYGTNYSTCEDAITNLLTDVIRDITESLEELTVDFTSQDVECIDNYNNTMGYMSDMYEFESNEEMEMGD